MRGPASAAQGNASGRFGGCDRPEASVVSARAYRSAVIHNGVLDAGTHLLPKPFGIDQMAEKLRVVLDG